MQYINGYICRCLALFFISGCIRLPEYHILQFHTFFLLLTQPYRSRVAIKFESEFKFILL